MKIEVHKPHEAGYGYYVAEMEEPRGDELINDAWGFNWFPDIDAWCESTFGQQDYWGEEPQNGWKRMRNKYYFTNEDKLSWFLIKWL